MTNCFICDKEGKDFELNNLAMRKCPGCGLIWRRDFDLPSDYYQNLSTNQSTAKLDQRYKNSLSRIKLYKKFVNFNGLCDIGTGEGIFLKVLKDRGYCNLYGLEPANENQEFGKKNELNILQGSLDDLSTVINNHQINTVSMFHVIEHLEDPLASLTKVFTEMKPEMKLIIETPNIDGYAFRRQNFKHKLIYPEHLFYFNEKNLRKLLEKIGFKQVAAGKRDFNPASYSLSEILFKLGLKNHQNNGSLLNKMTSVLNSEAESKSKQKNIIKKLIIFIGAGLIRLLGRQDYQWTIVSK